MDTDTITRPRHSSVDSPTPDALASAITEQRRAILKLEREVDAARDKVTRALAELEAARCRRDRAIFKLGRLGEELEQLTGAR
jgi:hypothetical protein